MAPGAKHVLSLVWIPGITGCSEHSRAWPLSTTGCGKGEKQVSVGPETWLRRQSVALACVRLQLPTRATRNSFRLTPTT